MPGERAAVPDNACMSFFINSPTGGGSFGTGAVNRVAGERALGFFRLNLHIDFVIEPTGTPAGQQDLPRLTELVAEVRVGGYGDAPQSSHRNHGSHLVRRGY